MSMTEQELGWQKKYQDTTTACGVAANVMAPFDLRAILAAMQRALDTAEDLAVKPPLWAEKKAAILADKELLEAALPLYDLAHERHRQIQAKRKADEALKT